MAAVAAKKKTDEITLIARSRIKTHPGQPTRDSLGAVIEWGKDTVIDVGTKFTLPRDLAISLIREGAAVTEEMDAAEQSAAKAKAEQERLAGIEPDAEADEAEAIRLAQAEEGGE